MDPSRFSFQHASQNILPLRYYNSDGLTASLPS